MEHIIFPSPRCTEVPTLLRLPGGQLPLPLVLPLSFLSQASALASDPMAPSHGPGLRLSCCQRCRLCAWNANHFFLPWEEKKALFYLSPEQLPNKQSPVHPFATRPKGRACSSSLKLILKGVKEHGEVF